MNNLGNVDGKSSFAGRTWLKDIALYLVVIMLVSVPMVILIVRWLMALVATEAALAEADVPITPEQIRLTIILFSLVVGGAFTADLLLRTAFLIFILRRFQNLPVTFGQILHCITTFHMAINVVLVAATSLLIWRSIAALSGLSPEMALAVELSALLDQVGSVAIWLGLPYFFGMFYILYAKLQVNRNRSSFIVFGLSIVFSTVIRGSIPLLLSVLLMILAAWEA